MVQLGGERGRARVVEQGAHVASLCDHAACALRLVVVDSLVCRRRHPMLSNDAHVADYAPCHRRRSCLLGGRSTMNGPECGRARLPFHSRLHHRVPRRFRYRMPE